MGHPLNTATRAMLQQLLDDEAIAELNYRTARDRRQLAIAVLAASVGLPADSKLAPDLTELIPPAETQE